MSFLLPCSRNFMQSLRDQLLQAGLVTKEQVNKADADEHRKGRRKRSRRRPQADAAPKPAEAPAAASPQPRKNGAKLKQQPLNRLMDLSDPDTLRVFQAIDAHRVRNEVEGEVPFYFTLRDGRVRRLYVSEEVSRGLEGGRFAIVENGEPEQHILVTAEAVSSIRAADPQAVRFHNQHGA